MDIFLLLKYGQNIDKNISKNLSKIDSPKLLDNARKSATDACKTASRRAIKKTAEAKCHLIGNKIAKKITQV